MTQESTVTPSPSPLSASLLAQHLPFSGGGFSSSCASLASLNARLFLPAFVIHRAAFPHPIPTPAAADSAAGRQGWRSQTGGEKCRDDWAELAPDQAAQIFPCRGARTQPTFLPSNSTQSAFTPQTGSLFLSLYAPRYCLTASAGFGRQFTKLRALSRLRRRYDARKKRSPRILHPSLLPHPKSNALLQGWRRALLYCFLFMHIRKARAAVYDVCRPMCTARYSIRAHRSIGPRPSRTTPRFCASTQTSKSITALARPITGRG